LLETNLSSLTSYSTTEYQATYSIKYLDKVFTVKGVAKVNQKMHSHALNSKMSKSNVAMTTAESESTRKIPKKTCLVLQFGGKPRPIVYRIKQITTLKTKCARDLTLLIQRFDLCFFYNR